MLIPAGDLWKNPGLAPLLMMEMYERLCPRTYAGRRAKAVETLAQAAWNDAGYCIDAPENMPAGACLKTETGPDDGDWIVEQHQAWR